MTQRREIKQRPQKVWDAARDAYLAGEPAASVARRFDVGYGNLRFRAHAEGWTRKAHMAAQAEQEAWEDALARGEGPTPHETQPAASPAPPVREPPPPHEAHAAAVGRAAAVLAEGRPTEALALLKAAEALSQAAGLAAPRSAEAAPDTAPANDEALRMAQEAYWDEIEQQAGALAASLLADESQTYVTFSGFAYHWRAAVLGPACAAADWERARERHWSERYWTKDGELRPLADIRAERTAMFNTPPGGGSGSAGDGEY